jgi:CO/xanthine dehydrogenase Mo-binding subunit
MAQIAAQELTLDTSRVIVQGTDTAFTPYDRSTGASRSTTLAGLAVQRAAADVRRQLLETAAQRLGSEPERLMVRDGRVTDGETELSYPELIEARFGFAGGEIVGAGEVRPEEGSGSYAEGPVFWEVCVAAAEVEVERETGEVRVRKVATCADVGKAINPQLVHRQDEGGAIQGLGNALFEEMVFADGVLVNDSLLDYRVPRVRDLPAEMHTVVVENADGPGPYGAKGCGEGAQAAVPAAIVTALADAGVPVRELPLTPERVWRRIREIERDEEGQ